MNQLSDFPIGSVIVVNRPGHDEGKRAMVVAHNTAQGYLHYSTSFSPYAYSGAKLDEVMKAAPLSVNGGYSDEHFAPIITGLVPVPNFEEVEVQKILNSWITCAGLGVNPTTMPSRALIPGASKSTWARYFLSYGQFKGPDGTGYVLYSEGGWNTPIKGGRFAICKHTKQDAPGANHQRGWHRGHCVHCGLDMTVDSSD